MLGSPFPIELPEPRPVGGDRFPSRVLALCLCNLDALTLSLFELFTLQAVFPKTDIQNCIIHQLRNSSKYVSYKDIKALMADLKKVYTAATEEAALDALDEFAAVWDSKYPKISKSWYENWPNLSTYFKFPQELRKLIYTTNVIEGFNRQLRCIYRPHCHSCTDILPHLAADCPRALPGKKRACLKPLTRQAPH